MNDEQFLLKKKWMAISSFRIGRQIWWTKKKQLKKTFHRFRTEWQQRSNRFGIYRFFFHFSLFFCWLQKTKGKKMASLPVDWCVERLRGRWLALIARRPLSANGEPFNGERLTTATTPSGVVSISITRVINDVGASRRHRRSWFFFVVECFHRFYRFFSESNRWHSN